MNILIDKEWLLKKRKFLFDCETFAFKSGDWVTGRVCKAQIGLINEILDHEQDDFSNNPVDISGE